MDKRLSERTFFENIRRSIKLSYFIASIIPLSILVYFTIRYVYPYITKEETILSSAIGITLLLALLLSVLGLSLSNKATNASISSLQDLYLKLNSLVDVTKHFRDTLYLDILLNSIIKSATDLLKAEGASLFLFDENGDLKSRILLGKGRETMKDRIIPIAGSIAGWVADNGASAIVNNVSEDPRFNPEFDEENGFKTRAILCVPLIYENNTIGVLEVRNKIGGSFDDSDEKILFSLADQAAISISQSRVYENQHSDMTHITEILISALDYHIPEKKGHSRRVAGYANAIGKNIGLSENGLRHLYYAALLHDIGLIKFDTTEYWGMKKFELHPIFAYEMIRPISLWKDVAPLILHHHERYDGKGYPHGKSGEEIPMGSRIIFIAETLDVLTSEHSYKSPMSFDDAIKEIEANSGTQFDPKAVQALKLSIKEADVVKD